MGYYIDSMGKNFWLSLEVQNVHRCPGLKGATSSVAYGVNDSGEIVALTRTQASGRMDSA